LGGRVYRNKRTRIHNQLDQLDNVGVDPVGTVRAGQGGGETEGATGRVQVESGEGGSACKERVRGRGMEGTNVGMGRKGRKLAEGGGGLVIWDRGRAGMPLAEARRVPSAAQE